MTILSFTWNHNRQSFYKWRKKTNAFVDIFLPTIESVKLVDKSAICVSDKPRNFRIFASWLKNYEI